MGHSCCSKQKIKRGLWSPEEDEKLLRYINTHGHKSWSSVPKFAGLQRCGKSCRLRWINYLRPDLKRGSFTAEEEQIIIDIHRILGNRWAQIAKHLPGRTDNEVKNFWNSCIKKKLISQGLDPQTHTLLSSQRRSSACTISNNIHQNSSSIFIMSSHIPNAPFEPTCQTFSTLPKPPPNIVQTPSTIVSSEFQTLSTILSNNGETLQHLPYELLMENATNICSPTYMNPSAVELCNNDNNVNWVSRVNVDDFSAQTLEEGTQVLQVQKEKGKTFDDKGSDVREANKGNLETSVSFESSNFDFGLLESVLTSAQTLEEGTQVLQVQKEKGKTFDDKGSELREANKGNLETSVSFESSNFDFGLLESVLTSEFISHDLNCMDELAWNF